MDNINKESQNIQYDENPIQSRLTNSISLLMIESESLQAKSKSLDLEINKYSERLNTINIQQNISNTIIARLIQEIDLLKNKKEMLRSNFEE